MQHSGPTSALHPKQRVREHCLQLRRNLTQAQAQMAAAQLAAHVPLLVEGLVGYVAAYMPVRSELDIRPACAALERKGIPLCLPVVVEKGVPLLFRQWQATASLTQGAYGIAVPHDSQPLVTPSLLLVPLLAFDAKGRRLGYGAGYYDRTIQHYRRQDPAVRCIGVAYAMQQVDEVPHDAHDELLDAVVTERGVMRFI